ncbi:zinc ribbon domain-containing protein [Salipaludibacillus daqingensis]|uniref:zinc ribbon domain-containing protein n=1 Tax=Salipaludibacillus daqingensis TaxID=3041001 RepID=UPI0024764CFA|nr:hypothetical protein [Salipaludibacillus daqingensis]
MKCKKCGAELPQNGEFCPECGTKAYEKQEHKKPLFTKLRITALSLSAIVIVALVVLYQVLANGVTPEQVVDDFQQAVSDSDAEALNSLIVSQVEDWSVDENDTEALLTYLEENQSDREYLFHSLDQHVELHNSGEEDTNAAVERALEAPYASLALKQTGKRWLIFDEYSVVMTPSYLSVTTNEDNVQLLINGEESASRVEADEEELIGPLGPGTYEVKGILSSRYMDIEETTSIQLFYSREDTTTVPVEFDVGVVSASTIYDDTSLYINGENSDITLGTNATEIGLLPLDGHASFSLKREFPWGTMTSSEFAVERESHHLEDFEVVPEGDLYDIMEMLNENWQQQVDALVNNDVSGMVHASDDYRDDIAEEAHDLANGRQEYVAEFVRARYRMDSIKYPEFNNSTERYELEVEAEYTIYEPQARTFAIHREDDDFNRTMYDMNIYFDEDEETWRVENFDLAFFTITSSASGIQEYEFD